MKNPLLDIKIQKYINANLDQNVSKLALLKNPFPELSWNEILNQISTKAKAKEKLPTFFNSQNIIYPHKISLEQTSSEKTAQYKASIVSGESLIDLTGGFGVDDYFFSTNIKKVFHCEINDTLSKIVSHNFEMLQAKNINCISGDSSEILKQLNQKFDWIYIDPSRRNEAKGKVFMLKDCVPNVPELLDFYFNYSNFVLVKTAPILDISAGLSELKNVKAIHIVAIENEVKELIWEIEKNYEDSILIKTINIAKDKVSKFEFILNNQNTSSTYCLPQKYLFEPNSAIMKSGGFDSVSEIYKLGKLHQHSHLYTSDEIVAFPGRVFQIDQCINFTKSEMKQFLEKKTANVTTRNFPLSVENIRKKWKIKDGGDLYCFFTTNLNNDKIVLICTKINQ